MVAVTGAPNRAWPGVAALLLALLPPAAAGQTAGGHPTSIAWDGAWYMDWSPLRMPADLPRARPGAPAGAAAAFAPATRIGLFWSGGNAGALPLDADSSHARFDAATVSETGAYRRPLESSGAANHAVGGVGWRGLGERSMVIGGVVAGRQLLDAGAAALFIDPFSSSPHVPADTSSPAMERQYARLEGATGTRIGGWGVGIAAGYQIIESGGRDTPIPRIARLAEPGLALGIVRSIGRFQLGAHGRWRATAETIQIVPMTAETHVFPFRGFADPGPISLLPGTGVYYRRMDREALALGVGVGGEVAGVRWVAYGERTELDEEQTSDRRVDPRLDRWSATGTVFGAAAQTRRGDLLLTLRLRSASLTGEAWGHDLDEAVFVGDETVRTAVLEAAHPGPGPWDIALTASLAHEDRHRRDHLILVQSEIETLGPGLSAELARPIAERGAVAIRYGVHRYTARAALTMPQEAGPMFRELIWPEVAMLASPAGSHAVGLVLSWTTTRDVRLVSHLAWATAAPARPPIQLSGSPEGRRSVLRLSLGAILN